MELANKDLVCTTWEKALSIPQRLSVQHALETDIKGAGCKTANIKSNVGQAFKDVNKAFIRQAKQAHSNTGTTTAMSTYLIVGLIAAAGIGLYFLYFRR